MLENKKIAIICDWMKDFWWAELVLSHILEIFPNASIYTSVFYQKNNPIFKDRKIHTSFIQKIPILNKSHKLALYLRPFCFESFDLSEYDIVISSSSAESKWVITKPECIHFCYCHTPTRYFWSHYFEYKKMLEFGFLNIFAKFFIPSIISKLRQWDFLASKRVDYFIANSKNTQNRIKKYYKCDSKVIYPAIDWNEFYLNEKKDYYIYIWRVIPYKKFDLIVDCFNKNWKKIIICTNTSNKLYKKLKSISKPNIEWKLGLNRQDLIKFYSQAKAFLFPPEEDFWLVPIEAMACWTPVIAYKKWWALETVIEWKTWLFFDKQEVDSLNNAIERFEKLNFDFSFIRNYAKKFDKNIFKNDLTNFINNKILKK